MILVKKGPSFVETNYYLTMAARLATKSTCLRRRCGSVIVNIGPEIVGEGFNSPPANLETQRRCLVDKLTYDPKVTDKTCCIHAEQRAILDAHGIDPNKLIGSRIYFASIDEKGNIERAGQPYCTLCSKLALDVGVREWVLMQEQGPVIYEAEEYNDLSFQFKKSQ